MIFPIVVILLIAVACTKKNTPVHCYVCISNDSVTSNIPVLTNPHHIIDTNNECQFTQGQIDFYITENTKIDTLYNKNDTLELEHWTMACYGQ